LKKQIYTLEAEVSAPGQSRDVEHGERSSLLGENNRRATDAIFRPLLDAELLKIVSFYELQEKELLYDVMELEQLVARTEEEGINAGNGGDSDDGSDDEDEDDARSNGGPSSAERHRSGSHSQLMNGSRTLGEWLHYPRSPDVKSSICPGYSLIEEPGSATRPDPAPLAQSHMRSENADLEASIASLRAPGSDNGTVPRSPVRRRARATSLSTIPSKTPLASLIRFVKPGNNSTAPVFGDSIWQLRTPAATDVQMLFKRRITTVSFG
jgi:phosphate transporter